MLNENEDPWSGLLETPKEPLGFMDYIDPLSPRRKDDDAAPVVKPAMLWTDECDWVEADIPKRPWVVVGYFMRGSVSIFAGPGGSGKSSLMKAKAIACALGKKLGNFRPPGPLRVLSYNVEDDRDEERRRLSAALRQFGASPQDLAGNLRVVGPNEIGTLIERTTEGRVINTRVMGALLDLIDEFQPDIILLDPLAELHTAEENDNTALRSVVARFRQLAAQSGASVGIMHHTRKGLTIPGDPDSIRGAGSIVGAVRCAFTVLTMSEDDANQLGVPVDMRRAYFRVDSAKANYAPISDADWYEKALYELDNGETIPAAIPWTPPTKTATSNELDALVAEIGKAVPPYSPRLGTEARSVAHMLHRMGFEGRKAQDDVMTRLYRECGVQKARYRRPGKGAADANQGLKTSDGLPERDDWL